MGSADGPFGGIVGLSLVIIYFLHDFSVCVTVNEVCFRLVLRVRLIFDNITVFPNLNSFQLI